MVLKRRTVNPKKTGVGASRDEEWAPSRMEEAELDRLMTAGVLPDRVTAGRRPASGEPFPMPKTDEVVVFEDYFWRGLGFPVHPFLRDLLVFWSNSLCNLHPTLYFTSRSLFTSVRHFLGFFHTSTSLDIYFG